MVRSKDRSRLGSSHQKNKFNKFKNRGGKKRTGSKLDNNIVPKEKLFKTGNQQFNSNSQCSGSSKRERNNSCSSESSLSEDCFFQLVKAVSRSKHKNISIISDESDLEELNVDRTSENDVLEHGKSSEESEVEDDHSDIFDDDESNNIVQSEKEDAEDLSEDPFNIHFQHDLSDEMFDTVSSKPIKTYEHIKIWPTLGNLKIILPKLPESAPGKSTLNSSVNIEEAKSFAKPGNIPTLISKIDWSKLHVKSQIYDNIIAANINFTGSSLTEDEPLSELQKEMFSIINTYQDLYYTNRTLDNGEQIRFIYSLHAVNHALKTRLKVIHHNTRLSNRNDGETDIPDEYRDQGLTRPKVLILVPFRDSAFRIIEMMISILNLEKSGNVVKKKRFQEEFTGDEISMPVINRKPEDYERTFKGNTDDTFRIGISVTKKSLKLYADFYSADIIIASPLGLRVIVGAEGEAERDFDFLASIEVLILDQSEIFLMQNWDHLLHVLDHFHLQPKDSHGTNFARVRSWTLNGWSRYYRQTLVFTAHPLPQISSLVNRKCHNYRGKVCVINPITNGSICQVVMQLPQVFHRLEVKSAVQCLDERFEIFINKILPQYKESLMSHTLIYIPSYFDYVRLRNYFKKETISFTQICEYSKENKIARARDMFFHSDVHFMLYSERFHFFHRIRLKGIRHILFYQPPTFPHFYSEMCNFMKDLKKKSDGGEDVNMSVSVLYSKFDAPQLAAIVGSARAARMLSSDRPVHMFMTGD